MRTRSPAASTRAMARAGSDIRATAPATSRGSATTKASSTSSATVMPRRSSWPATPRRRSGGAGRPFLDEPAVPESNVDQCPEHVVVVVGAPQVLADERVDVRQVEMLPDERRLVQQRDHVVAQLVAQPVLDRQAVDRKSTRLNSSHVKISYAVFCLKKQTR